MNYLKTKNIDTDDKLDLIIFVPHANTDAHFIEDIYSHSSISLNHIPPKILQEYIRFEADIGTDIIAEKIYTKFFTTKYKVGIVEVLVPRALCDMNRPKNTAIASILDQVYWWEIYESLYQEIESLLRGARNVLHLHSMNDFEPIDTCIMEADIDQNWFEYHIDKKYSWELRQCNLLTQDEYGDTISNRSMDKCIESIFQRHSIVLQKNSAYRLRSYYPCNRFMREIPSSFIEIRKGLMAEGNTEAFINSATIILSPEKIDFFANVIFEALNAYISTKNI